MEHTFFYANEGNEEEEEEPNHAVVGEKEEEPSISQADEDYRMAVLLRQQEEEAHGIQSDTTTTTTTTTTSTVNGRTEGGGQKRKREEMTALENRFVESAVMMLKKRGRGQTPQSEAVDGDDHPRGKAVTFNVPEDQGVDRELGFTPGGVRRRGFSDLTGRRTSQLSEGPLSGSHPLKDQGALESDSAYLARRVRDSQDFTPQNRPGMASALLVGDTAQTGTSMRTGRPNVHPVVTAILSQVPRCCQGKGHGHCAEVNTISTHLWDIEGATAWDEQKARGYFERAGAATAAHRASIELTDPCPSCVYLTQVLCIATINATTPRLHQLVENVVSGVEQRYLHCARTAAMSRYLWAYEERHGKIKDIDQARAYLQRKDDDALAEAIGYADLRPTCPCCTAVIQGLVRTRPGG